MNEQEVGTMDRIVDSLRATLAAAKDYEHSYGQAREEALADYGNKYNVTVSIIAGALVDVASRARDDALAEVLALCDADETGSSGRMRAAVMKLMPKQ